jgi:hypothetical protein
MESHGEAISTRNTEELLENPVPVPLSPSQIPHELTRASVVRGRRLIAAAMTRPELYFIN